MGCLIIMQGTKLGKSGVPVLFATLCLIAIAITAGIATYIFTSGSIAICMGAHPESPERAIVHSFTMVADTKGRISGLEIYAQNVGEMEITVNTIKIKDTAGNTIGVIDDLTTLLSPSKLTIIKPLNLNELTGKFKAGNYYAITLLSDKGASFTSLTTKAN